jgi:hypothetical protein
MRCRTERCGAGFLACGSQDGCTTMNRALRAAPPRCLSALYPLYALPLGGGKFPVRLGSAILDEIDLDPTGAERGQANRGGRG